jgi:uncharacterized protein YndB with AHSA1/START domain
MNHQLQLLTTAPPGEVWRALTSSELTARYLYGMAAASTWSPGSCLRLTGPGGTELSGEILAAAAPHRLSYSLQAGDDQPSTYVTWEVWGATTGSVVRLYVDEPDDLTSGGPGEEAADAWAGVLAGLEAVLDPSHLEQAGPALR